MFLWATKDLVNAMDGLDTVFNILATVEKAWRRRFSRSALREYLAAWFACSPYEQERLNAILRERERGHG